jgi:hypothetical protein
VNRSILFSIAALPAALTICLSPLSHAADLIGVTQKKSGKTIQVEMVNLSDDQLTFKTKNGKSYTIGTDTITADSHKEIRAYYLKKSTVKSDANTKKNHAIAHPLF